MSKAMTWYQFSDAGMAFFDDAGLTHPKPDSLDSEPPKASVSNNRLFAPTLRGLAYGDGFFTTIGVHQRQILGLAYHQARIRSHCEALHLYLSRHEQTQLWQDVATFAHDIEHGIIKIIVSRPTQSLRGYAYADEWQHNHALVWVGVMPSAALSHQYADFLNTAAPATVQQSAYPSSNIILQQPPIIAACLSAQLAALPPSIAGLKSLNRLDGVMSAGELERLKQTEPNLSEGLVQDMSGNWVEGVMSNVFYQLKNTQLKDTAHHPYANQQWFTPPIEASGVRGTLRQAIIDNYETTEYPVVLRQLGDDDLTQVSSMFFCNAVRGVMPVRELIVGNQRLELSTELYLASD